MKKSIILDIFKGAREGVDIICEGTFDQEIIDRVNETYKQFKDRVSPQAFDLHEEYVEALRAKWLEEVDYYFVEGFKMGLLIGIECTGR